jgi:hypothetical protein
VLGRAGRQRWQATVPAAQADAIVAANRDAGWGPLRTSLTVVALVAAVALLCTGMIPVEPAGPARPG